ncbi:MAG: hypothetical protein MUF18_00960 [Fimbriiglobus sp.]|jgi:hypothetical protein|nr:hypothetical protein [Fimbriiglobus sp.]
MPNRTLHLGVLLAVAGTVAAQSPVEPKFNAAAGKMFPTKVQPLLSNLCADCHAHPKHTSPFKLKAYDPGFSDPQTAETNLRAVTRYLDVTNPHASPLLKFAITAHGKAEDPPLKAGHPALKGLELWTHWACGPDGSAMPTAVPPPRVDKTVIQTGATKPASPFTEPARLPPVKTTPLGQFADTKPKADPTKPNPIDPFDPAGFNKK